MTYTYLMSVHKDNGYYGEFYDFPICTMRADNISKLLDIAKRILKLYLTMKIKHGEMLPEPTKIVGNGDEQVLISVFIPS